MSICDEILGREEGTLDVAIDLVSAASHIGMKVESLEKHIVGGAISVMCRENSQREKPEIFVSKSSLDLLIEKKRLFSENKDFFKNMYAMVQCGVPLSEIEDDFRGTPTNDPWSLYLLTFNYYADFHRVNEIGKLSDDLDPDKYFTINEVAQRLRLTNLACVRKLIGTGQFEVVEVAYGKKPRKLVTVESVKRFLGSYSDKVLYQTREVADAFKKTTRAIGKQMRNNDYGFKLFPGQSGLKLLSKEEALDVGEVRRAGHVIKLKDVSRGHSTRIRNFYAEYSDYVKRMFALQRCGVSDAQINNDLMFPKDDNGKFPRGLLWSALDYYKEQVRPAQIDRFTFNGYNPSTLLTLIETMGRLGVGMVNMGRLTDAGVVEPKIVQMQSRPYKMFAQVDINRVLGNHVTSLVYPTHFVFENLGISMKELNAYASEFGLGFQFRDKKGPRGRRFFSHQDVEYMIGHSRISTPKYD